MTLKINKEQSNKINNSFDASYARQLACVPAKVQKQGRENLTEQRRNLVCTFGFLWVTLKSEAICLLLSSTHFEPYSSGVVVWLPGL